MMTGFQRALFATAFSISLSGLPALADTSETPASAEPAKTETTPAPSEKAVFLAAIDSTETQLRNRSREVLAADGDRSTSETRKELAIWMSGLADRLDKGVPSAQAAMLALHRAELAEALAVERVKTSLSGTLEEALSELSDMNLAELPQDLRAYTEATRNQLTDLKTQVDELAETKPVLIELAFEEPLEDEIRLELIARFGQFGEASGISFTNDVEDISQTVRLEGIAPATLSAQDLRDEMSAIWTEVEMLPSEENDAAEAPLVLPAPQFVGITLG
ncbi:MAG: hypothetical protein CMK09_02665 [Ponticaulis sp.]|nr:hypothetical protein [Ponticaulis sp.]|tara:strand:+ start:19149 stop:19979 length:831 start_codon:yes stop_codon:yes gene_type:complete